MRRALALSAILTLVLFIGACASRTATPPSAAVGPANVDGLWTGSAGTGGASTPVTLQLKQSGSNVTGTMRVGGRPDLSGPLEGSVEGDGIRVALKNGYGSTGELRVRENQISGVVSGYPLNLRRSQ